MIRFTEDKTKDTDFRVLRPKDLVDGYGIRPDVSEKKHRPSWWTVSGIIFIACTVIFLAYKAGAMLSESKNAGDEPPHYIYEPVNQGIEETEKTISAVADSIKKPFTEHTSRTVNDIVLDIYIPHAAKAELVIGTPDITDKSIIFAAQAADIRADNGKIVGAFVMEGKPLSWGLSKKGFASIIDNKITVGVAENSPLFEEATEKGGYFFRQYPLVSEGHAIDNEPKGKAVRKALCDRNGEIMVIMSAEAESFHDFAQALADFGVDNAVYLVGSNRSYGFYRDGQSRATEFSQPLRNTQKFENYIIWRAQ